MEYPIKLLIKYKKLSFNKIGVFNTVSIPHPSRFRIGENQDRVISILEALDREELKVQEKMIQSKLSKTKQKSEKEFKETGSKIIQK